MSSQLQAARGGHESTSNSALSPCLRPPVSVFLLSQPLCLQPLYLSAPVAGPVPGLLPQPPCLSFSPSVTLPSTGQQTSSASRGLKLGVEEGWEIEEGENAGSEVDGSKAKIEEWARQAGGYSKEM